MSSAPSASPADRFKGYRLSNLIWWPPALAVATVTIIAALNYPGGRLRFVIFIALSLFMVALIVPKPRLYGYTFLSAFLFLGFCAKTVAYLGLGIALVEPTGSFNGTGASWDAALAPAIAGCGGVVAIRVIHLVGSRLKHSREASAEPAGLYPPYFYVRHRKAVIAVSMAVFINLSLLNLFTALYQVGVAPRIVLPMHLNVVVSWLVATGFALWAATLFIWEVRLYPHSGGRRLLIPFVEAIVTISTLSRAAYLFRVLPYLAVLANHRKFYRRALTKNWRQAWLFLLPAGFLVSLIAVSTLRALIYPLASADFPASAVVATPSPVTISSPLGIPNEAATPAVPSAHRVDASQRLQWAAREVITMIVGRWIGIEGTMAVSSYRGSSLSLLGQGLLESPRTGESSTYQRISGSGYNTSRQFVFLTTPGAVAILEYSGSVPVVLLGMAVVTGLLLTFELLASRILVNSFAPAVLSLTLANAIAQADFPYLLLVALLEQSAAVAAFGIVLRIRSWTRVVASEPEMSA